MSDIKDLHHQAYTGEAKAAIKLKLFADKADQDGYKQIAKLFRVISYSEEIHAARSLRKLKQIKTTEENLAESFESEMKVANLAYSKFIKEAIDAKDTASELIFTQNRDVEEIHSKLYQKAMNHMLDESEAVYHVCKVCGYVSDFIELDVCPVCNAKKDQFITF
ncbi:rubrerythrin family protein [Spirochaetota bacterium]